MIECLRRGCRKPIASRILEATTPLLLANPLPILLCRPMRLAIQEEQRASTALSIVRVIMHHHQLNDISSSRPHIRNPMRKLSMLTAHLETAPLRSTHHSRTCRERRVGSRATRRLKIRHSTGRRRSRWPLPQLLILTLHTTSVAKHPLKQLRHPRHRLAHRRPA